MARYIPINKAQHKEACWTRFQNYTHAAHEVLVPLMATELVRAQQSLPISFTRVNDNVWPAAVLSIRQDRNLFVTPNGNWIEGYVPAQIRSYPFRLAHTGSGEQVLCFDEESGLMGAEGTRFFDDDGEPSDILKQILDFLHQIEAARTPTQSICKAIEAAGLLVPWDIKINMDGVLKPLNGLLRIDEQALLALPAEQLKALADAGAFPAIYAQLMSMQNIGKLQTLAQLHRQAAEQQTASGYAPLQQSNGELDLEFLNRNDTIKF